MEIEQINPRKPNFLLVVILSGITILILFVLALFFIHFDGKHLTFRHHSAHPTSQLRQPAPDITALG
jgi:flagellar basal body-associated protein FliL